MINWVSVIDLWGLRPVGTWMTELPQFHPKVAEKWSKMTQKRHFQGPMVCRHGPKLKVFTWSPEGSLWAFIVFENTVSIGIQCWEGFVLILNCQRLINLLNCPGRPLKKWWRRQIWLCKSLCERLLSDYRIKTCARRSRWERRMPSWSLRPLFVIIRPARH